MATPVPGSIINPPPTPPFIDNWFELDGEKNDLNNVMNFLEHLPEKLKRFFEDPFFRQVFEKAEREYKISMEIFFSAFKEATDILNENLNYWRTRFEDPEESESAITEANDILRRIGFTGQALILKAELLNQLSIKANKPRGGLLAFLSNPFSKGKKTFLKFLNKIFGSLLSFVPGLEAIKEIKDAGEATLDLIT